MKIEPGLGLGEQDAAGEHDDGLMQDEEAHDEREARDGMFGVELGADG